MSIHVVGVIGLVLVLLLGAWRPINLGSLSLAMTFLVGALVVANAEDDERPRIYRGLLLWGAAMVITAPLLTWLIFIIPAA